MLFLSSHWLSFSTLNDALLAAFQLCSGRGACRHDRCGTYRVQVSHFHAQDVWLGKWAWLFNLLLVSEKTPEWIWFSMHTLCQGSCMFEQKLCACCRPHVKNALFKTIFNHINNFFHMLIILMFSPCLQLLSILHTELKNSNTASSSSATCMAMLPRP